MSLSIEEYAALQASDILSPEQQRWLSQHEVFTRAQLHKLHEQIRALDRIVLLLMQCREGGLRHGRALLSAAPFVSEPVPTGRKQPLNKKARVATARKRVATPKKATPKKGPGAKRKKAYASDSEPELSDDSETEEDEGDSDADVAPVAKRIELRPRKQVNFAEASDSEPESLPRGPKTPPDIRPAAAAISTDTSQRSGAAVALAVLRPVKARRAGGAGDDAACCVCGESDVADDNAIVFCDGRGCDVAVHQACYGLDKLPRGRWLCDACRDGLDAGAANCACCPVVGGALREVVSTGSMSGGARRKGRLYLHLACALWTPEVTLAEPHQMRGVRLASLTQQRLALQCALCKQAGGAVIECSFPSCSRSFHVLCGRAAGHLLPLRASDGHPLCFCGQHSQDKFKKERAQIVEGSGDEVQSPHRRGLDQRVKEEVVMNEFEMQRLKNIERNRQRLAQLHTSNK